MTTTPTLLEVVSTSVAVPAAGGIANPEIAIDGLPAGFAIARIFEVVGDSDSVDFDVQIFEDAARTRLNRDFDFQTAVTHLVQLLVGGQQYRDRDVVLATDLAEFHVRVTNNDAAPENITVRIRYELFLST